MTNKTDDAGKGAARPGDGGKRPYATIDLQATEIGGPSGPAPDGTESVADRNRPKDRLSAALSSIRVGERATPFLSHLAAGVAGAIVTLLLAHLLIPASPAPPAADTGLTKRLAEMENAIGTRPGAAGLRTKVEELVRSVGALDAAQVKAASDAKVLEGRIGTQARLPPDAAGRLTKIEESLAALSAGAQAGRLLDSGTLATKVDELQKSASDAQDAAKAAIARSERELAELKAEAARLAQLINGLKGDLDERLKGAAKSTDVTPLAARITAIEQDVRSFGRSEADRNANASRIVLSLELASLKRAMDRGGPFAAELAAVKKAAGGSLDLAPLERYMSEGAVTVSELTRSFRKVANAMLDTEVEPADATIVDRLLSSARSVVRVRKAGHKADDKSVEAVIGRMEDALKDGRLGEVIAQGKSLPPKAALAGEDWLKKAAARHTVDTALADIDAALKTSIGTAGPSGAATTR